ARIGLLVCRAGPLSNGPVGQRGWLPYFRRVPLGDRQSLAPRIDANRLAAQFEAAAARRPRVDRARSILAALLVDPSAAERPTQDCKRDRGGACRTSPPME